MIPCERQIFLRDVRQMPISLAAARSGRWKNCHAREPDTHSHSHSLSLSLTLTHSLSLSLTAREPDTGEGQGFRNKDGGCRERATDGVYTQPSTTQQKLNVYPDSRMGIFPEHYLV